MAALTGTNGVLTIANTTDTFTSPAGTGYPFLPANFVWFGMATAAAHMILQDADGVAMVELYNGAATASAIALDQHFFIGMRPWKTPIKLGILTSGKVRMAM